MRQIELRIVAVTGVITMLLALAGCGTKNDLSQQKGSQTPATVQAGLNDNRIPPERRAQIEQMMAQQKMGNDELGAKRAAAEKQAAAMKQH